MDAVTEPCFLGSDHIVNLLFGTKCSLTFESKRLKIQFSVIFRVIMNDSNFKYRYFFFNTINFLYFVCGLCFVIGSIVVLTDSEKILISRLISVDTREPILYYVCLAALLLGLFVSLLSTIGCWAVYTNNNWILASYIFGVVVLLLAECVTAIVTILCPDYLGLRFEREPLTEMWQHTYSVPGKEQYTVAIDLVQVKFECCGVTSGNDFSTSWWHLKDLAAPNLTVPISCCYLDRKQTKSFLDPVPINLTACQNILVEIYHNARHYEGCFAALEVWLRDQKMIVLLVAILNLCVQLLILFAVVSSCVRSKTTNYDSDMNKPMTYMSHMAQRKY